MILNSCFKLCCGKALLSGISLTLTKIRAVLESQRCVNLATKSRPVYFCVWHSPCARLELAKGIKKGCKSRLRWDSQRIYLTLDSQYSAIQYLPASVRYQQNSQQKFSKFGGKLGFFQFFRFISVRILVFRLIMGVGVSAYRGWASWAR